MRLQILVPQYKETEQTVLQLLNSIECQQGIDIKQDVGVIMVNDGSDVFIDEGFLSRYSFPIEYHKDRHRGIAGTRNALLRYATADYIMFCDADDMFCSLIAIYSILNAAYNQNGFDELICYFYAEGFDASHMLRYSENTQVIHPFIHGKIFNRKYLLDNNIWFNEDVDYHEDVYFSFLAHSCATLIKQLPQYAYIWKFNPSSITRQSPEFSIRYYHDSLKVIALVCQELLKRGKKADAQFYYTCCLFNSYTFAHTPSWLEQKGSEYWNDVEQWLTWLWDLYGAELFNSSTPERLQQIWNDTMKNALNNGALTKEMITEPFTEWMQDIIDRNNPLQNPDMFPIAIPKSRQTSPEETEKPAEIEKEIEEEKTSAEEDKDN